MYVELDALGVEWEIEVEGRPASIKFPALPRNAGDGRIVLEEPPGTPSTLAARVELWGLVSEQSKVADIYRSSSECDDRMGAGKLSSRRHRYTAVDPIGPRLDSVFYALDLLLYGAES